MSLQICTGGLMIKPSIQQELTDSLSNGNTRQKLTIKSGYVENGPNRIQNTLLESLRNILNRF